MKYILLCNMNCFMELRTKYITEENMRKPQVEIALNSSWCSYKKDLM